MKFDTYNFFSTSGEFHIHLQIHKETCELITNKYMESNSLNFMNSRISTLICQFISNPLGFQVRLHE